MKKLLVLLVAFVMAITFLGCDDLSSEIDVRAQEIALLETQISEIESNLESLQDDYELLESDYIELQNWRIEAETGMAALIIFMEKYGQYEEMLDLLYNLYDAEHANEDYDYDYELEYDTLYTGQLTLSNYQDRYHIILTETTTLYFTVQVDTELDINIWSFDNQYFNWIEFHESGTATISLPANEYIIEIENYYDYDFVNFEFMVSLN